MAEGMRFSRRAEANPTIGIWRINLQLLAQATEEWSNTITLIFVRLNRRAAKRLIGIADCGSPYCSMF